MQAVFLHGGLSSIQACSGQWLTVETRFGEFFCGRNPQALKISNIALLAQKNDQNRSSTKLFHGLKSWEFTRFFFSDLRIPQPNDDVELLKEVENLR